MHTDLPWGPLSRSPSLEEDAFEVIKTIEKDSTTEMFQAVMAEHPTYRLDQPGLCGWFALGCAATQGNIPLVDLIVAQGGKDLLNQSDDQGLTPLFLAVYYNGESSDLATVEHLLELGADPEIPAEKDYGCCPANFVPKGASPLWVAAEKAQDDQLVKALLKGGAKEACGLPLSPEGTLTIQRARAQINAEA
jgi:hypothetical protein